MNISRWDGQWIPRFHFPILQLVRLYLEYILFPHHNNTLTFQKPTCIIHHLKGTSYSSSSFCRLIFFFIDWSESWTRRSRHWAIHPKEKTFLFMMRVCYSFHSFEIWFCLFDAVSKVTLDIICATAFGYHPDSVHNDDNELAVAYHELLSLQSGRWDPAPYLYHLNNQHTRHEYSSSNGFDVYSWLPTSGSHRVCV